MKFSRATSVLVAASAVGLGLSGTASATVTPQSVTACTTEPTWTNSITVNGTPAQDHIYTLTLPNGTFNAEWSSAWNLAVNYTKTGGAPVSGTFEDFIITSNWNADSFHQSCHWGNGSSNFVNLPANPNGTSRATFMFTGANQPPMPSYTGGSSAGSEEEVIAVMNVPGQGIWAIGFPG
jgi:hypothetical protein